MYQWYSDHPDVFFSISPKDFLSEIDLSVIQPKNLTGLEGMKDVKSDCFLADETEKGVVFIDFPWMIPMLLDLSQSCKLFKRFLKIIVYIYIYTVYMPLFISISWPSLVT